MSWWLISIVVWFVISFGSIATVLVAAEVRGRRERRRIASDDAVFQALMATLDPGPRTLA